MSTKKGIIEVFWTNVLWHAENKKVPISEIMNGNTKKAQNKIANVTLKRVQEISQILDIDDYAILFEEVE